MVKGSSFFPGEKILYSVGVHIIILMFYIQFLQPIRAGSFFK